MTAREEIAQLRKTVDELRSEVADLRRFQSWIMGGLGAIGITAAFAADVVKKKLGWS